MMSAKLRSSSLGVGRTTTNWRVAGRLAVLRWRNVACCILACLLLAPAIGAYAAGQNEGAPGAPGRPRTGPHGQETILFAWDRPLETGTSPITGYRVEVSRDAGSTWTDLEADTDTTALRYLHMGLPVGTTRHYRVSAINGSGPGPRSNVASATVAGVPSAVRNLVARVAGEASVSDSAIVDLSWQAPADPGTSAIIGYFIEWSERGPQMKMNHWYWWDGTRATATTFRQLVAKGATRYYRVRAFNRGGSGTHDKGVRVSPEKLSGTPGAPGNFVVTAVGWTRANGTIRLSWEAPADPGTSAVTGYRIERLHGSSIWTIRTVEGADTNTWSDVGLQVDAIRRYRVSAINSRGPGTASNIADATTDGGEATTPGAPGNLVATATKGAVIYLSWSAPTDMGTSAITGYRVEVSSDAGDNWTDLESNTGTTNTKYRHAGLALGTTRHYRVSAINEVGTGPPSDVASATAGAVAPDWPTGLVATAAATLIDLTWTAPEYDGGAPVTSYRIEVSEDGTAWSGPRAFDRRDAHDVYAHRAAAGNDASLPGVGHQLGGYGPAIGCGERDHGRSRRAREARQRGGASALRRGDDREHVVGGLGTDRSRGGGQRRAEPAQGGGGSRLAPARRGTGGTGTRSGHGPPSRRGVLRAAARRCAGREGRCGLDVRGSGGVRNTTAWASRTGRRSNGMVTC